MMAEVKMRHGKYMKSVNLTDQGNGSYKITFAYNKSLLEEIKALEGARWNPEGKFWTFKKSLRNEFQLEFLKGGDPYGWYDQPILPYESKRPIRQHQKRMVQCGITFRRQILAAEMGTGKSLSAIEIIEWAQLDFARKYPDETFVAWWVAPKSALRSVELELKKWKCSAKVELHTYDSLKRAIQNWPVGKKAPYVLIGDESSRVKTPTAQRTQATMELARGIREDWGKDGFIILMSGTPAPKSPVDWWAQCEIAEPGFLKEGTYEKCKRRMGLIIEKESISGGVYPHLETWLDDANKCKVCGKYLDDPNHHPDAGLFGGTIGHTFEPSVNEVELLYQRMMGLVHVVFKKDVLDLPEKQYETIYCKPTPSMLRSASIIASRESRAITVMTLLRELSDGFQYEEEETGTTECTVCKGKGEIEEFASMADVQVEITEENREEYSEAAGWDLSVGEYYTIPRSTVESDNVVTEREIISCPKCGGSGETVTHQRVAVQLPCPKEDVVKELLDRYDDVGRTVWFAGFSGSIDRVVSVCRGDGWDTIRVDGRGWECSIPGVTTALQMLELFQNPESDKRIAFIGQPGAAGMGLTLTRSPMICYYSNDFNAESRIQSEDRIHRLGMDLNRACMIYDIVHLPTDQVVIDNLKKKRKLQSMSLGEITEAMKAAETQERVF